MYLTLDSCCAESGSAERGPLAVAVANSYIIITDKADLVLALCRMIAT